ncbi:MAG TPA: hypothetical protein VNY05_33430, partial [Candidatus Acidoferrales bacterium]|nr:hypothetical protein [Candidatus Acidoferrales bacterium]
AVEGSDAGLHEPAGAQVFPQQHAALGERLAINGFRADVASRQHPFPSSPVVLSGRTMRCTRRSPL